MPPDGKTAEVHTFVQKANVLQKAMKNKGLERSFKMAIPKEVYEMLDKGDGRI